MSKTILKELPELVEANVIPEETADRIRAYYAQKEDPTPNRLIIVFGILGALLVALGIILIVAHNWDDFSKPVRLFFALLPMLAGQVLCGYTLIRKQASVAWRESASAFLFLSLAAAIAIVSQVYNIEGTLAGFLFIWMLLGFPIIYIMQSSITSLLYIIGITWYASELSYFHYPYETAWWYWGFLALVLPHYYLLYRDRIASNFFTFHSWLLAISVTIVLGMFGNWLEEIITLVYINAFCIFILIGQWEKIAARRLINNGFLIVGSLGLISLLLFLSFDVFWEEAGSTRLLHAYPFWISFIGAGALLVMLGQKLSFAKLNVKSYAFIAIFILYAIGLGEPFIPQALDNIILFVFGVFTIRDGAQQNRLSVLNYGLLILTALIVCRFFDLDMSFVVRGLLFVLVGSGFFVANLWMVRKRKAENNGTTIR
ncbi:MAG TPA: DUF2157 domain-containing protein [Ohtaekwangia sp.]|uniref:DUF2157 domain-containing protein n=1 Tax=Ohtaekwangia sp. TaxID=2066019 RepID=UPI002F93B3F0